MHHLIYILRTEVHNALKYIVMTYFVAETCLNDCYTSIYFPHDLYDRTQSLNKTDSEANKVSIWH